MKNPVIAIDGPAASGKGTLARKIAAALGFAHMDTGLLYRAVGYIVLGQGGDPSDENAAVAAIHQLRDHKTIETMSSPRRRGSGEQKDQTPAFAGVTIEELRAEPVTQAASKVAAIPAVRAALVDIQRSFAANPPNGAKGAVLDGRDIGTVICPNADVKLFITASIEARAGRRYKELQSNGIEVTYDAVLRDMRMRDARDSNRSSAPMIRAENAIEIDTTDMTPEQALDQAMNAVTSRLGIRDA